MDHDPYSACVCGSGRKLKFCCHDILPEMEHIEQLRDNQPDMARKQLEKLYAAHPDREVLVLELAGFLQTNGETAAAKDVCVEFLRRHPNEPRVTILLAELLHGSEGFESSRRIIHRALQLAQAPHYRQITILLVGIASERLLRGHPAAAWAHLKRATQFASKELRGSLELLLSTWTRQMPDWFPLLGPLDLLPTDFAGSPEDEDTDARARRLHELACWEPAAILCRRLAARHEDQAAVWYNCGLFHLWDSRPDQAAECLHRAASLMDDFDLAAETEALAILLDMEQSEDRRRIVKNTIPVSHPRELSERLRKHDAFHAVSSQSELHSTDESSDTLRWCADEPDDDGGRAIEASITITANIGEQPDHHLVAVTTAEDRLNAAWDALFEAAGDVLRDDVPRPDPTTIRWLPESYADFDWQIHFDPSLSARHVREAIRSRTRASLDAWMNRPQPQFSGRTPQEAAADPDLKLQRAAVGLVLYCLAHRAGHDLSLSEIRERLQIPDPVAASISEETTVAAVPLLTCLRLNLSSLTDDQVCQFVYRTRFLRNPELMESGLQELFRRPQALETFPAMEAHMMQAGAARERDCVDDMAAALDAARSLADQSPDSFRRRLEIDLKELGMRMDDPEDPDLRHLLRSIRERYFSKMPELADAIREELHRYGCGHLAADLDVPTIITAEETASSPASGKLWLPGDRP